MKNRFLPLLFVLLLTGCSSVKLHDAGLQSPTFDLYSYFTGSVKGWGMVQDRKGKVLRQFVVVIEGRVDDENQLLLDERFTWSDGELSTRVWKISASDKNGFRGSAEDVLGTAKGDGHGNAFNWHYHLNVVTDGSTWKIKFDDWMFLQPDGVLINKTAMSKFGFHVGEVTIVFFKQNVEM